VNRLGCAVLALFASLSAASAQAATVAIVRPAGRSAPLTETLFRLHGELLSIGLGVQVVGGPAALETGDLRAWMERTAAERALDAVLEIVGEESPVAIDIWIFEGRDRRAEVSRVGLEPKAENGAERLAIRAIEVLRSSLLETRLAGSVPPQATAVPKEELRVAAPVADTPGRSVERIAIEGGAALLTSFDGVGPAILPVVRVGWPARDWLGLQVELAGLGSRPSVATDVGAAEVGQQYGVLGACFCERSNGGLRLYLALAGGLLRTTVDGRANAPGEGHSIERWSFLLDARVGARWRSPGRYYLTLAGHVQVAEPYVAIHILGAPVATTARPNLLLTLTVGAWL
jgi:hypothetical protein